MAGIMARPLPPVVTAELLESMSKDDHLPRHSWYIVAATTLSQLNRPDQVATVYQHAINQSSISSTQQPSEDERQDISRRIREALIKASAVTGVPKVDLPSQGYDRINSLISRGQTINSLLALKAVTPPHMLDVPSGTAPTARSVDMYHTSSTAVLQRGEEFFNQVYGKVAGRVMGQMDRSGTEDLGLLARKPFW